MKKYTITTAGMMLGALLSVSTSTHADPMAEFLENKARFGNYITPTTFPLTRPIGVDTECAPHAFGLARVSAGEEADILEIGVVGMPKNSNVEVFAIQVPGFPFGLSWYVGDIKTDSYGVGVARYVSRFNEEIFAVAPGLAVAPQIHDNPIADAADNPATAPIHTYHIGIWFDSAEDAVAAGCAGATTPFNGEHNAGVQVLNTAIYPDQQGPLLDPTIPSF